jgi:hypothetical protein
MNETNRIDGQNMPLYQGTKQLRAKPMSKVTYCDLRGWGVPPDEDPHEAGYLVEYQDEAQRARLRKLCELVAGRCVRADL